MNLNINMDNNSISSNTINQNNTNDQYNESNQMNDKGFTLCKFCNVKLSYGMDSNSMLHCQDCHNVWDGFAQCRCDLWLYEMK